MPTQRDPYDSPWKSTARRYFRQFVRFFFPALYPLIDWPRGWRFQEQELEQVSLSDKPSTLIVDLLVEISLRDREQKTYLHIEIQEKVNHALRRRMFTYFARIYALKEFPVVSLLITPKGFHSASTFHLKELEFNFLQVAIERMPLSLTEMIRHKNPFGLVCAAYILARSTRGNYEARRKQKLRITRAIAAKRWSRQMARDVFRTVNWMMALPPDMEREFWRRVLKDRGESKMKWMCPIEKIFFEDGEKSGLRKGLEQGIDQGIQRGIRWGIQQGRKEAMTEFLARQLEDRFGPLSNTVRRRLEKASTEKLSEWGIALLDANSLTQVFRKKP
jgi:hypothetical protein